ncbi:Glucose/arabinose dehydrogenase, beta-propeller fold [Friedmanniella luteola]|uniref:Glucose/arabinose dehydrogenase, beta-propeller fold n=1 Tax=Friedmanniella luteola TaxID=546871 RepID=A0A1H1XGI2_9ACTN|nr:PQQ-dependent sugar dehydrogenase [Friedmanniella luteola]SDT07879.1 Glucose/arabinose dehydrogenase, beta-propeller fold [Friedmanniella luteola]
MLTRRTLLLGSSAAALGAAVGCSADPVPATGPSAADGSTSGSTPLPPGPASPAGRSASATPTRTTPSPSPTPRVPRHPTPVLDDVVADGLDVPWGLVFLASGDALVGERGTARLRRVTPGGRTRTLGEVAGVVAPTGLGEGGLLGLALAPGDEETLFAHITTADDDRVVRMSLRGGRLGRPRVVLAGIPTSTHHHGGRLLFDRGGRLLVSTGDAEQRDLAQDRGSLAGKILRLRPDGRAAAGNPFGNRTWSYGHRNVEGLAFDDAGRLWATEFGDKEADELNLVRAGRDYGWPDVEGRAEGSRSTAPAATWSPTSTCSPAGVAIAGSTAFVGALQGRCLFAVPLDGTRAGRPRAWFAGEHGRLRTVALAPDRTLWVTTSNTDGRVDPGRDDDKILRLRLT